MLKATDMAVYEAVQTLRLTGILTPGYPDHLHNVLCDLDAQHEQRRPVGQHGNTIRNELEPLHLATGRDDMVWDPICEDDEELQTSSDSDEDAQWGSPGERYYEYLAEKRAAMGANRQICWPNDFGHTELSKAYLVVSSTGIYFASCTNLDSSMATMQNWKSSTAVLRLW